MAQGTFDDRFILRFTNNLAISKAQLPDTGMTAFIKSGKLCIRANSAMEDILVYDVSGKLIRSYEAAGAFDFTGDFPFANGVYLARVKLENGAVENRKLVN
jgi:hypothetical protein